MDEELVYKIGITRIPKVGAVIAKNLISYCGGVRAVFEAPKAKLLRIPGIGEQIAHHLIRQNVLLEAEAEIRFLEKQQVLPLFYLDEAYPERLRHLPDCPVMLYYRGEAPLNSPRHVAIVGTRRPSPLGIEFTRQLVQDLKPYGVTVISGLAYGIDISAHRRCVELDIPTIGVLGHGLREIYPPQHRPVAEEMTEQGGLLTEYLSYQRPDREHFPMRNRIIAGLCDALVVVETQRKGGSMISAEMAGSYNKDVFAMPGRINDPYAGGCNFLIKSHRAALLEKADDLAYIMGWDKSTRAGKQQQLFVELTEVEKIIVALLRQAEAVHVDELAIKTELPGSELIAALLQLECKGIIRSLPGKRYTLINTQSHIPY